MDDQNSVIESIIINLGETTSFIKYDPSTKSFTVDRDQLNLDLVGEYNIKVTLLDDEAASSVYHIKVIVFPDEFGKETQTSDIL